MHNRTGVSDDANSTPARADAETAQARTDQPGTDVTACRWCRKTHVPLRRPAEQVRPLLEGNGAPVHGCDPCLSIVERGLIARGLELASVNVTDATGCKPWCVEHEHEDDEDLCRAPDEDAPRETGHRDGVVRMAYDSVDGYVIDIRCKLDALNLYEAEQVADAIRRQLDRARSACAPWCVRHDHQMNVCHAPNLDAPPAFGGFVGLSSHPDQGTEIFLDQANPLTLDDAETLARAILTQVTRARRASR